MHKGKEFAPDDLSQRSRGFSDEKRQARCNELTERFKVVAVDTDERADRQLIIAEELNQRILNRLPSRVKRVVGMMARYSPEIRAQVLTAFSKNGELINPFATDDKTISAAVDALKA